VGPGHAEIFQQVREEALDRLVEVRGSLDHAYASIPGDVIRPQFDLVLDKMDSYLATGHLEPYKSFACRWMAMRTGEGFSPENLIHVLIATGDVVAQVAQGRMGQVPECADFVRAVVRMNLLGARILVELLADELAARQQQRAELRQEGGR
jgi:hypothetical protein